MLGGPLVVVVALLLIVLVPGGGRPAAQAVDPVPENGSEVVRLPGTGAGPPPALAPAPYTLHPGKTSGAVVNPFAYYSAEPAPMGIADFGVGAGDAAYTYNSSAFLANFSWEKLNLQENSTSQFTVQLNVVLVFSVDTTTYVYWVQDVAWIDSATVLVSFEDNIWNFSRASACLSTSAVSGNGTVYPYHSPSCEGYYAASSTDQPGADRSMPSPGNFSLLLRSYRAADGAPEVAFEYWDGASSTFVTYDNVVWPWATGVTSDQGFVVDGTQYTPNGGFYDAEAAIGGPGGGASTEAEDLTHTELRLFSWNGHNFQAPRSAWNFGSDTGETVSDLQSLWSASATAAADGTPLLVQWNGTPSGSGLDHVYNQSSVGYLNLSSPGVLSGTLAVGSTDWAFVDGAANVTLAPGSYPAWENSSAGSVDLGLCTITGGNTTSVNISTGCTPAASQPTASATDLDVGQSLMVTTSLLSAGSGGDSFSWKVTPDGLGCVATTNVTLGCTPTAPGTYALVVTVTDSQGQSMSPSALVVVVNDDPTVTLNATPPSVDVGEATTLRAVGSGGTGSYRYVWSSLPTGCVAQDTAVVTCLPTAGGASFVEVVMTDSAGWAVAQQELVSVYADPAITSVVASPAHVVEGNSVQITVSVTGGQAPLSFAYVGLPSGCSAQDLAVVSCQTHHVGTYSVEVVVTDANGFQVNATASFTVDAQVLGLPFGEGYLLLDGTILGAAVAVALAVVVARGRVARRTGPRWTAPRPVTPPPAAWQGPSDDLRCPHCGNRSPEGSRYCGGCGTLFAGR